MVACPGIAAQQGSGALVRGAPAGKAQACQVGQAQARAGGQRVGSRHGEQERLGDQHLVVQAAVIEGEGAAVPASARPSRTVGACSPNRPSTSSTGRAACSPAYASKIRGSRPPSMSALSASRSRGAGARQRGGARRPGGADRVERAPGLPGKDFPGGRQRDLACCALEQRHTELALQLLDRAGQRRLRHAEPLGRAPEVQLFRDRHEDPELPRLQLIHALRVSTATGWVLQVRRHGVASPTSACGDAGVTLIG